MKVLACSKCGLVHPPFYGGQRCQDCGEILVIIDEVPHDDNGGAPDPPTEQDSS